MCLTTYMFKNQIDILHFFNCNILPAVRLLEMEMGFFYNQKWMDLTMIALHLPLELLLSILHDLSKSLANNSISRCSFVSFKAILTVLSSSYSLTPCTSKQLLREYCLLSSE